MDPVGGYGQAEVVDSRGDQADEFLLRLRATLQAAEGGDGCVVAEAEADQWRQKIAADGHGFCPEVVGQYVFSDLLVDGGGCERSPVSGGVGGEGLPQPCFADFAVEMLDEGFVGRFSAGCSCVDDFEIDRSAEDAGCVRAERFEHFEEVAFFLSRSGWFVSGDSDGHSEDLAENQPVLECEVFGEVRQGCDAEQASAHGMAYGALRCVDDEFSGFEVDSGICVFGGQDAWSVDVVEYDACEIDGDDVGEGQALVGF